MRQRDASLAAATVVGWAGVAAVTACLLVREVAPYPRWDVIACLGVVAAASLWWSARARAGAPASRPGRTKGWWPQRRWGWNAAAMIALFVPLLLLLMSAQASTPRLAKIRAGDATVERAEVREVHGVQRYSTKGGTSYTSDVTVTVRAESDGGMPHRAAVRASEPAEPHDLTWALYAADNPGAGVVLDPNAGELRALLGDSVSTRQLTVVAGLGACVALLLRAVFRSSRPEKLTARFAGAPGGVRRMPAHLGETAAAGTFLRPAPKSAESASRSELHPTLLLHTPEGPRPLYVDRSLDPQALSGELGGKPGELYWAAGDERVPSGPEAGIPALVVLDDRRYLYGTVTGLRPGSGEPVPGPFSFPEGLRAIGPYAVWQPGAFRPLALGLALTFLCALLSATGLGSSAGYAAGLGWPLLGLAVLAPIGGLMLTARAVTRRLRTIGAAGAV